VDRLVIITLDVINIRTKDSPAAEIPRTTSNCDLYSAPSPGTISIHTTDTPDAANMKILHQLAAFLAVLPGAIAVDQKKSAIIYFDNPDTPDSIVDQARQRVIDAGGKITHVYSIIKYGICSSRKRLENANGMYRGFSAIAPEKALEMVQTFGEGYSVRVEEDQVVSASG
jgi:hypothetical protein